MPTRRDYLLGSCATVLAGVIAGCSGTDDEGDDPEDDGEDGDDSDDGASTDDVADLGDEITFDAGSPGEFGNLVAAVDDRPVSLTGQKPARLYDTEGIDTGDQEQFYGADLATIDFYLSTTTGPLQSPTSSYEVIFGEFAFDEIRTELEDGDAYAGTNEVEEYRGFRTIEALTEEGSDYFGLRETELVTAGERAEYEFTIDTIEGDNAVLVDDDERFDSLLQYTGDPDLFTVYLEPEPQQMVLDPSGDAVAGSAGVHLADSESVYNVVALYEDETTAAENEAAVSDAVLNRVSGIEAIESGVDGAAVLVRATIANDNL